MWRVSGRLTARTDAYALVSGQPKCYAFRVLATVEFLAGYDGFVQAVKPRVECLIREIS